VTSTFLFICLLYQDPASPDQTLFHLRAHPLICKELGIAIIINAKNENSKSDFLTYVTSTSFEVCGEILLSIDEKWGKGKVGSKFSAML